MAEIHYNFWGEELYSKQKALEGKFSLLHEERALISQVDNNELLAEEMNKRLQGMLDLALAHKDYRHLLDSFVQWIIELFMDFEKRVIPDHTRITEADIEELEYWDQEFMQTFCGEFGNQEVRKRDVFNDPTPESELICALAKYLYHELGDCISIYIDQYTTKLKQNLSASQPSKNKTWNKGKTTVDFDSKIRNSSKADRVKKYLHALIDGKKGKNLAKVVSAAVRAGLIHQPSFKELKSEFKVTGSQSGYYNYIDEPFPEDELESIIPKNISL